MADEPLLRGNDESTPIRALNRTALVVAVAVIVVLAIAYALYEIFGGKSHGSTLAPLLPL
jgi:hypothetical protein